MKLPVLYTHAELKKHDHRLPAKFHCHHCLNDFPLQRSGGTGYAVVGDTVVCYPCCAELDRERMRSTGRITLYLAPNKNGGFEVTNWPGTLRFPVGRHNIAGVRNDVWFIGPDNMTWHGVQYGDNTQLCHCKRVKS